MKFSEQWLRTWINPDIDSQGLMDLVTMAGLEVDGSEPVAGEFTGIVVGEILTAEQHPNADKLQVCKVSDGSEEFQVVCGAPNARAGLKVAFAKVGAVLGGDFKIKKAKLRQVESFGMLCSEKEIELSDSHEGIMELAADAPLGMDLREYLDLNDIAIEVDLTPNRADCFSIIGLAREVRSLTGNEITFPEIDAVAATHEETFPVTISAPEGCPRYAGRVIKSVDVTKPTPLWMVERLRRSGIRTIDPVVDITNYVMLELGQPMHGFDLDQLKGGIEVRHGKVGEKLLLLDGNEIELDEKTLLITDETGPLALAGVMGGENTGVSADTKNVFLESAFFAPIEMAGTARSYGLHTDSSMRFERGVDYANQVRAIERATQLMLEITGGEPGPVTEVASDEHIPADRTVTLTQAKLASYLGSDEIPEEKVEAILTGLGLELTEKTGSGWTFNVPSHRFDISLDVDLIEEVARVYGYNNLPTKSPECALPLPEKTETEVSLYTLRRVLVSRGYQEAVTYSFIDEKMEKLFDPEQEYIELQNPISSDLAIMRTTLLPGLVNALNHNLKRQQERVRLFETGLRFRKVDGEIVQDEMLAGLIYGSRLPKGWYEGGSSEVDFFDIKADVEAILDCSLGNEFAFKPSKVAALHPGQTAEIALAGETMGYVGALHPSVQKELGLKKPAFVFELEIAAFKAMKLPKYEAVSKFPGTSRDLAVLVDAKLSVQELLEAVHEVAGEYLKDVIIFDVYQGKGIDLQRKSVAIGLTWQHPSRTLNDEEINEWFEASIKLLETRFEATLRG